MWHSFQEFIPKIAAKKNFAQTLKSIEVCHEYRRIAKGLMPKDSEKSTYPKSYKDGTFTVAAISSVWAQELNMKKYELTEGLNKKFGDGTIKKLRIEMSEDIPSDNPKEDGFKSLDNTTY